MWCLLYRFIGSQFLGAEAAAAGTQPRKTLGCPEKAWLCMPSYVVLVFLDLMEEQRPFFTVRLFRMAHAAASEQAA
jgi:hypothetical protein